MRTTTITLALTIAGLAAFAGTASGQDDLLRGPRATEAGPPGAPADFAPGADGREPTPAMRHNLLMAAIRTLERDEAIALSGDQQAAIEAQDRLYRAALEAYREANAAAYESLRPEEPVRPQARERQQQRRQAGDASGRERAPADGGVRPERRRERITPEQREEMKANLQALRDLERNAPSPAEIDANIWSLLTPDQQQAVERRMERLRNAAAEKMRERAGDAERRGPERGDRLTDAQRERIRRAMQDMTPEERRAFLEQIRQRLRERSPGERRPAPPMEEIEVPPPGR